MTNESGWVEALIERLEAEGFTPDQIGYVVGECVAARAHGAAVAFGLMGMTEAIRISHHVWERPTKRCVCSVQFGHFSHCPAK
jgi:hypothetical protein